MRKYYIVLLLDAAVPGICAEMGHAWDRGGVRSSTYIALCSSCWGAWRSTLQKLHWLLIVSLGMVGGRIWTRGELWRSAHIWMLLSGRAAGRGFCLLPGMGARDGELLVNELGLCPICQGARARKSFGHTYIHTTYVRDQVAQRISSVGRCI